MCDVDHVHLLYPTPISAAHNLSWVAFINQGELSKEQLQRMLHLETSLDNAPTPDGWEARSCGPSPVYKDPNADEVLPIPVMDNLRATSPTAISTVPVPTPAAKVPAVSNIIGAVFKRMGTGRPCPQMGPIVQWRGSGSLALHRASGGEGSDVPDQRAAVIANTGSG